MKYMIFEKDYKKWKDGKIYAVPFIIKYGETELEVSELDTTTTRVGLAYSQIGDMQVT